MTSPMAIILLDGPAKIDTSDVVSALRARYPDKPFALFGGIPSKVPFVQCGREMVALLSIDAPAPEGWQQLAGRARVHWPDAAIICQRHRAHIIVSAMRPHGNRVEIARIITAVTGAVAASIPGSTAVVWDSQVVYPARSYIESGPNAFAPYPCYPCSLWMGFHPFQENGLVGLLTHGLRAFVGREIEVPPSRAGTRYIVERAVGLATYLVERGDVVRDGDTVGISQSERIKVCHSMSARFSGLPVLIAPVEKSND